MANPWKARHIGAEAVFNGGNFNAACTAVDFEYNGREEETEKCGICGQSAYYRATVGAFMCPNCNAVLVTRIDQSTGKYTEEWR